jgi:predicted O-linked N-acetylglucosamine transferase (SPINDLY family)
LDADCARAHEALAALYHENGLGDAVYRHCAEVVRIQSESGTARLRLAFAYALRGRVGETREERLAALTLGLPEGDDRAMDVRLRLYDEHETASTVLAACRDVFRAPAPTPAPASSIGRRRSGPLRIGYLSGEYKLTPAYFFLTPFLANHDRSAFELFLYHSSPLQDFRTATYRALSHHWRDVSGVDDGTLLAILRRDQLDVLVDLSGHFPRNRLAIFPHRPATVQATFPNFPCTTGCSGVDYFFTDSWTSPPGSEAEYSERLHRLPSGYLVYAPPSEAPAPTALPAHRTGRVTIGVFQRLAKITSSMWDLFCEVLRGAPETTLLLQNSDLDMSCAGSDTARFLSRQLIDRGVDPGRLRCVGRLNVRDHFEQVATVDLALDMTP